MLDERFQSIPDLGRNQRFQSAHTAGPELIVLLGLVTALLATGENGLHVGDLKAPVLLGKGNGRLDLIVGCRTQVEQHRRADREVDQFITVGCQVAVHRSIIAGAARCETAAHLYPMIKPAVGQQVCSPGQMIAELESLFGRTAPEIEDVGGARFELFAH
ncbi:hypothetical protein D3C80_1649240 [compost metagenome]